MLDRPPSIAAPVRTARFPLGITPDSGWAVTVARIRNCAIAAASHFEDEIAIVHEFTALLLVPLCGRDSG